MIKQVQNSRLDHERKSESYRGGGSFFVGNSEKDGMCYWNKKKETNFVVSLWIS